MKKILNKHKWLFLPICILTIVQSLSIPIFLIVFFDSTFWYVFTGVFKYSEIQTRALEVAGLMQLPALIFWVIMLAILQKRKKANDI